MFLLSAKNSAGDSAQTEKPSPQLSEFKILQNWENDILFQIYSNYNRIQKFSVKGIKAKFHKWIWEKRIRYFAGERYTLRDLSGSLIWISSVSRHRTFQSLDERREKKFWYTEFDEKILLILDFRVYVSIIDGNGVNEDRVWPSYLQIYP